MKNIWFIAFIFVYPILIYLIINNWNNESIRNIGFSVLIVSGLAGLVGVLNILKTISLNEEFAVSIVVSKENPSNQIQSLKIYQDLSNSNFFPPFPYNFDLDYISQEFNKKYPEYFTNEVSLESTYHEIVSYYLLDLLFNKYHAGWLLKTNMYETESGQLITNSNMIEQPSKKLISWNEIVKDSEMKIFKVEQLNKFRDSVYSKLCVPPNSKVKFITDSLKAIFEVDNKYSNLKITIRKIGGSDGFGLTGYYIGLDVKDLEKFKICDYVVIIESEIKKMYSGSKNAGFHQMWISSITTELKNKLDYSFYLKRLEKWYDLNK